MIGNIGYERRLQALERRLREISNGSPVIEPISFTPGLYQGGAVTCTVTYARYSVNGRIMACQAMVVATAAGTAGNTIALTDIPYAPKYADVPIGIVELKDASAGTWYSGIARTQSGFGSGKYVWGIESGSNNSIGINPAITIAIGDVFSIKIEAEIP